MDFTSRFLFHGNAAALGGRIVRHDDKAVDYVINANCECSLMPVGGRSELTIKGKEFGGGLVRFGSASTFAEGIFEDHGRLVEASRGAVPEHELVALTKLSAEVRDVEIGVKPKLKIARVSASLQSRSPRGSGQPSITPVDKDHETAIEGVTIDGHELIVELNLPIYRQYDTHAKLLTAADDADFVEEHGHCLFLRSGVDRRSPPQHGRLVTSPHGIHGTIVKALRWKDGGLPGAEIDHNSVKVPNFGTIFFGELMIGDRSRRLTMARVRLGSPTGGEVALSNTEPNGSWS